jgi:hypothetical protein
VIMLASKLSIPAVSGFLIMALVTTPESAVGQSCPQQCDQKFEGGQLQHRLGQGNHGAVTGPEYHEMWYVNPCSTDHNCSPEDDAVEAVVAAIAAGDMYALMNLTKSIRGVEINWDQSAVQVLSCKGLVVSQVAIIARTESDLSYGKRLPMAGAGGALSLRVPTATGAAKNELTRN